MSSPAPDVGFVICCLGWSVFFLFCQGGRKRHTVFWKSLECTANRVGVCLKFCFSPRGLSLGTEEGGHGGRRGLRRPASRCSWLVKEEEREGKERIHGDGVAWLDSKCETVSRPASGRPEEKIYPPSSAWFVPGKSTTHRPLELAAFGCSFFLYASFVIFVYVSIPFSPSLPSLSADFPSPFPAFSLASSRCEGRPSW
ncbi:hypothetical protein VTK73DRAFT_8554 [Phialemonium thermophilum]|uniref:Uncharacterized protein n=1 Tax=Phialemonium thermophilum TaxID=223376 RepID=A0ABR3XP86_9PEZI